ncbi:unnamed protein product [Rotaria sp. Silwood1]|nr:unnamed protein product [Rotaria sp. Silwood1]
MIFLSSLDTFYQEQSFLPIDPLHLFLYFLPNETSIYSNNLFTPVCRTIHRLLRSRRFLPVINDNNLHMPNECVFINDLTIKEILTPELLYNHLNLYYLKDDLYEYEKQLYELGVHHLGHNELINFIKQIFTTEITIENKKILSKCIQLPKLIENDLMIINDELWMNLEENSIERIQIQTLLERLGIQRLTHRAICEQHIYPIFENDKLWKEKSSETLIAYVMYIFDLWSKQ